MPEKWDGVISHRINRKFSTPLAKFLARYELMTPNQVTIIGFLIGLLSPLFFILGSPVAGGLLAQISSIIDGADGELARLRKMKTKYGGYLDAVLDRYVDAVIIAGMIYYSFIFEGFESVFVIGLFAIIGSMLISYTAAKAELDFNKPFNKGISSYAASRDVRIFLMFIGSLFTLIYSNAILVTLVVLAVLTNFIVILRLIKKP